MCGRFALTTPMDAVAQMFGALPSNNLPFSANYNICPTDTVAGVVGGEGRRLVSLRWGFVPQWYKTLNDGPLLINARAESLAKKPAFRDACRTCRCLIPASGYYEWGKAADGARLPWYFTRQDEQPVVFAGIWQSWDKGGKPLNSCAIVTTSANEAVAGFQHRMPVVLEPQDWALWLGESGKGAATLMRPAPEDTLQFHRVDTQVNSNRAQGAGLIKPLKT